MELPILNFPQYNFRFKKNNDNSALIFDIIRKQWLVLTPEEWVRQNWIHHLIHHYKFSPANIIIEQGIKVYKTQKRSDIVVRNSKGNYILVECKRTTVNITQRTLLQALRYNLVYNCPYIILSNGLDHLFFQINQENVNPILNLP